ncbi:MAG TPA: hypothetical protein VFK42_14280 [Acidimicrobiales bacterium]|jgi:hypothetical protein|nr:hypothetical protein [Acidimicrobiales bacterium]
MRVLVAGTLYGTAASVVWDDGLLRARSDVKQLVEIVADVEEFDLGHPEEAATAIMVALDTVRDIAVHG